ncbi:virion-associated protein [Proteus phage Privateer]|uniref:Virion-associated protein n=1 Tax=Proteus phage Privateer TaxID=2712958 RepID=A0A6G8R3M9_9CAUD|nr:virion-associated protein [Proteus phage Privateer]QIN94810.1 virion-associated protein [Proteus phage Privateer]
MSMIYKEGTASLTKGSPVLKGKDTYFLNPIFNVGVGQIVQVKTGDNVYVNSIKEVIDNETLILSFDSLEDVTDGEIVIMITMVDSISDTANKLLGMTRGLVQFETEMTKWFTSMDKKITITLPDGTKKEVYTLQAIMEQVAQNEKEMQELLQNSEKKVNDMVDKAQTDVNQVVTDGTNKINQAVDKADKEIGEAITSGTGKIDTMLTESQKKIDKTIEDTEVKVDTELGKIDEKIGNRIDGKVDKSGDRMTGSLGIDSKEFSQSIEINADAEQDRTSIGNKFKDGSLAVLSFYKDRLRYSGKDIIRDGDYGVGYKANNNNNPPQNIFNDANEITYSGFGAGNAKSTNFFDYGAPLISAARFGGSDSTGQVFQLQSRVSKTNNEIAYRTRNTNEWTDWLKLAVLDTVQTQTFKGAIKARILDVESGNDYFGIRIHANGTPAFYSYRSGKGYDYMLPNISQGGYLWVNATPATLAWGSYTDGQNIARLTFKITSTGDQAHFGTDKTNMFLQAVNKDGSTADIKFPRNSGDSWGGVFKKSGSSYTMYEPNGSPIIENNGNFETRFYGLGSKPSQDHLMVFMRNSDKMFGVNYRGTDNKTATVFRVDCANKVAKINEVPVMVEGDFGLGRAGMGKPQNISCFQGVPSASVQGFPTNGAGFQSTYQTNRRAQMFMSTQGIVFTRFSLRDELVDVTTPWNTVYSSKNTTVDSNGFIKRASPIIKVFGDGSFEVNDESEGSSVEKISNGVYRINNVLGLNSDDSGGGSSGGFEIPIDNNKLPMIWLDYEVESDGSIILKTYHREHKDVPPFARNLKRGYSDGDPCDIPNGRFVSVRVNMPEGSIFNQMMNKVEQEDKEMESNPFYKEERAFPNIIFNKKGDL